MEEVIKNMRSIIRRYATCMENNIEYQFKREELETIKKAIKYLDLIDELSKSYRKDKREDDESN
jgi:hypothetical protein